MKVYKFYYCGEISSFFDDFGDANAIAPLVRVNDEFKLESKDEVWLYAVTDSKKRAKMFEKFRDMSKFISVVTEMDEKKYCEFMELTDGICELRVERFLPRGKTSPLYEDVVITTFEKSFIADSNLTLRSMLRYNHGLNMLDFLANSQAIDSYLRKSINTLGLITMVDELKSADAGMDDLPFTSYITNQYTLYYYLFGFTYKNTKIGE